MSINVNKITSTLAKLGDAALQQYAQMHKNDPYIMALAMSESNRRKELRAAGQSEQGATQEQPKVVDQMLAEMAPQQLPEDQGIGQLPAGDMNFAGGGIVAFADGGDVERYNGTQGSLTGGLFETDPQKLRALAERRLRLEQLQQGRLIPGGPYSSVPSAAQSSGSMLRSINPAGVAGYGFGLYHGDLNTGEDEELARRRAMGPTLDAQTQTATFTPDVSRSMLNQVEQSARKNAAVYGAPAKVEAKGKGADKTARAAPTADTGRKESTAEPVEDKNVSGLNALINNFTRSTELAQGELRNRRVGLASQLEQTAQEDKAEGEKRRAARGDVFAKKEARLAEREKSIAGLGDKYMGLALLQAGAAMMTTPGNLGMALGKGVQVGSERYIAGIDKINAAKDKFAEARDRLDELRLNRDDMNEKEIRDENRAIRNARLQGQQLFLDGATNDLKISNDNQKAIFGVAADSILTDKKLAAERANVLTRERGENIRSADRLNATLNTPERMAFLAALDKTKTKENPQGDPAAAYQSIIAMKREPVSLEKLRGDWLDMGKRAQIQADYPNIKTFDDYLTVFGGGAGGGGADGLRVVGVR